MTEAKFRVIWVCGAPGAGKSVAAWRLFERSAEAGSAVAYVDIDQLGMLYPATDDDPYRFGLKSAAVDALIPGYAAAGTHTLIISGVVDAVAGPVLEADVELTVCVLSPGGDALRKRLLERGWQTRDADQAAAADATLRAAGFVDVSLETSGLSIAETADRLERFVEHVPQRPAERDIVGTSPATPDVIVITGPRAVGTSRVGFGLALRAWHAGHTVGFLDLQQLGFVSDRSGRTGCRTELAIRQLATVHRVFAEHGAERLVVSAHLTAADRPVLRAAFRSARVSVVRLRADAEAFTTHVQDRARGSGARLAADDLLNADERHQAFIVQQALAEQEVLDDVAVDDLVVDVSRRTPAEAIGEIGASYGS